MKEKPEYPKMNERTIKRDKFVFSKKQSKLNEKN